MKFLAILFVATCLVASLSNCLCKETETESDSCDLNKWLEFTSKYNKVYKSQLENNKRRGLFCETLRFINEHNTKVKSPRLAINDMADWTDDEKSNLVMDHRSLLIRSNQMKNSRMLTSDGAKSLLDLSDTPLAEYKDYRYHDRIVTPVKDQAKCGSCWAFGATALVESMEHKWDPTIVKATSLSEQQLVDCVYPERGGCNGGLADVAFAYIKRVGGQQKDSDYPYVNMTTNCATNTSLFHPATTKLTGFLTLEPKNEDLMKRVVAEYGPITIRFQVTDVFYNLKPFEVYKDPQGCNGSANHQVLIVGYGTSSLGEDYWIIKNSWSSRYGDNGYYYLARNLNNSCSVADQPLILV